MVIGWKRRIESTLSIQWIEGMKWQVPAAIIALVAMLVSAYSFFGDRTGQGPTSRSPRPNARASKDGPVPARAPISASPISSPAQPSSPPYIGIDGSGGTVISPSRNLDTAFATRIYMEQGKRYEIYATGQQWHRPMWRSTTVYPYSGASPSLAFEACRAPRTSDDCPADPTANFVNAKDREELAIINHATGDPRQQLKFGRTRYLSFLVYFHEGTEVPMLWTLISQVWQVNDENGPPFAIWLKPSRAFAKGQTPATTPISLRFAARDKATTTGLTSICEDGDHSAGCPVILYSKEVVRGRWYRFTMRFSPSLTGNGQIAIWDGGPAATSQPAVVWNHDWGYATGLKSDIKASDAFDVRLGIYRREQPRALKIMFDNIRFGPTAASVD